MSYLIKDNYHTLTVSLETNISASSLSLKTYINGSTSVYSTYSATAVTGGVVFKIPFSDYSIGDEITNIRVVSSANIKSYNSNEGINILLNGEDYAVRTVSNNTISSTYTNPVHTEKFAIKFNEEGDYTLQTAYRGNNATNSSYSDVYHFIVNTAVSGTDSYALEFVDKNLKELTWNDKTLVKFILLKNGVGVSGKTVESVTPSVVSTATTDINGETGFTNNNYDAGTYKIGAYYVEEGHIVAQSEYKEITIKKADAVITYTEGTVSRNSKFYIYLKDSNGDAIKNEKLSVYVNGKLKTKTTDSSGKISFTPTKAQTYKFKVVYNGNNNINSKTLTITKVVS